MDKERKKVNLSKKKYLYGIRIRCSILIPFYYDYYKEMVKNTGGGRNHKKGKSQGTTHKRELRFKEDLEEYALVEKVLGDCRLECLCTDGSVRICHIRGKFRKRVWMTTGDVVLISMREFQDNKADVIYKYTPEEVTMLRDRGEISFKDTSVNANFDEDMGDDALVIDMTTI